MFDEVRFFIFESFLDCQVLQKSCRSHTKIFISLTDILKLLHTTSENCQVSPVTPGVLQMSYKNMYKVDKHSGASMTSEKCPEPPGFLQKSYKDIYKLDRHCGASITSEKCLGPPGTPGVLLKSYKNVQSLQKL